MANVDAEIKVLGFEVLFRHLGLVETEQFITLIQREKFDYTQSRQTLFAELSGEEISRQAMEFQRRKEIPRQSPQRKGEVLPAAGKPRLNRRERCLTIPKAR